MQENSTMSMKALGSELNDLTGTSLSGRGQMYHDSSRRKPAVRYGKYKTSPQF